MGEQQQGRFGPPPVVAVSLTAMSWPDGTWSITANHRRAGERFERTLTLADCSRADVLEAAVVELYRELGQ